MSRIEITAFGGADTDPHHDIAKNAKVYIGDTLCGTMQSTIERQKTYTINCDATGDFVKIVTGHEELKLGFHEVKVYAEADFLIDSTLNTFKV